MEHETSAFRTAKSTVSFLSILSALLSTVLVVGGSKIACTARALRVNAIVTKATERWPGDAAVSEVADRMCVEVLALHIKAAMELRQMLADKVSNSGSESPSQHSSTK